MQETREEGKDGGHGRHVVRRAHVVPSQVQVCEGCERGKGRSDGCHGTAKGVATEVQVPQRSKSEQCHSQALRPETDVLEDEVLQADQTGQTGGEGQSLARLQGYRRQCETLESGELLQAGRKGRNLRFVQSRLFNMETDELHETWQWPQAKAVP